MSPTLRPEPLEPRHTPSLDVGSGIVQLDGGPAEQVFGDWRGPLNVTDDGGDVWVGAGPGGGPRYTELNRLTGAREIADQFGGPPASREGIKIVVPPADVAPAADTGAVPLSLEPYRVTVAPGTVPTDAEYVQLEADLALIPDGEEAELQTAGVTIELTAGTVTSTAVGAPYAGVVVDKPGFGAAGATVDQAGGLLDPVTRTAIIRLDDLAADLHEYAGHGFDLTYPGGVQPSQSPAWQAAWKANPWPRPYDQGSADEAWADTVSDILHGVAVGPGPTAVAASYGIVRRGS